MERKYGFDEPKQRMYCIILKQYRVHIMYIFQCNAADFSHTQTL